MAGADHRHANRAVYRLTGGRFGLRTPTDTRWGMLRLTTIGRRSGKDRVAILGYIEDGAALGDGTGRGWEERARLWGRLVGLGSAAYTDANAGLRSRDTAIVVFEPRA